MQFGVIQFRRRARCANELWNGGMACLTALNRLLRLPLGLCRGKPDGKLTT
jgi:hypothetical protein